MDSIKKLNNSHDTVILNLPWFFQFGLESFIALVISANSIISHISMIIWLHYIPTREINQNYYENTATNCLKIHALFPTAPPLNMWKSSAEDCCSHCRTKRSCLPNQSLIRNPNGRFLVNLLSCIFHFYPGLRRFGLTTMQRKLM